MSKIIRQDTNGVKPLLAVGELGYDNYPTGGDAGRVYVGNGSENIPQAKKSEVVTVDGKIDTHIGRGDNPHTVTKTQVGLGSVDNTADSAKNVLSATKLTTARAINGVNFDGTTAITVTANTAQSEIIKFDTGTTEGTDLYTFNGSSAKTINIKAGTNVTLTKSTGSITINANDTSVAIGEVSGLGTGVSTFLSAPTSANLAGMLTDETGTGANVFANSPTLVTPVLGVATGTSFNSITGLSSTFPVINGVATIGTSTAVAKADHIHPSDTTKVTKVTSTDNAIVRFDGTTGAVQNSGVIIDDSWNIGLGATPNQNTNLPTIFGNYLMATGYRENYSLANCSYQSGYFRYLTTGLGATSLLQVNGSFEFRTAPSGTAGDVIPLTTAMTLGSNGNLLVGTTTDNGVDKLQVNGSISSGVIIKYNSGDLNNFKYITQTIGTYSSAHMSNTPINDHGYLEIIVYSPNTYVMQRFTTLGAIQTAGRVFVRCLNNGTWTAWAEK